MALYTQIRTFDELDLVINAAVQEALDSACEIAIEKLLEFIQEDIYDRGESDWYNRTEDLLDPKAWVAKIDRRYNNIVVNIHFNGELSHDATQLQHGTIGDPIDYEGLIAVLNNPRMLDFDCNLSQWYSFPSRHFWDDFEEWMRNNFSMVLREQLILKGLNII